MGWGRRLRRRLRKIRDEAIQVVKEVPQSGIDVVRGKKELVFRSTINWHMYCIGIRYLWNGRYRRADGTTEG
jgi:hypothetical protein